MSDKPLMNILQFEYALLNALNVQLGQGVVDRNGIRTQFAFPIMVGDKHISKRAVIEISVVDAVFCTLCKEEIYFPSYGQQTADEPTHNGKCPV